LSVEHSSEPNWRGDPNAIEIEHFDSAPATVDRPVLVDGRHKIARHLLELSNLRKLKEKIQNQTNENDMMCDFQKMLMQQQSNENTVQEVRKEHLFSHWNDIMHIKVDGIPIPNSTQRPHNSTIQPFVTKFRSNDLQCSTCWNSTDEQLARAIEVSKRKQIWLSHHEEFRKDLINKLHQSLNQQPEEVWPWELTSDPIMREVLWAEIDKKSTANKKKSDKGPYEDENVLKQFISQALRMFNNPPNTNGLGSPLRRHLLDTFGGSLRHVNALYNKEFGKENRKAPAHMPHFIDRDIMSELQSHWPNEYDRTSSHRFRAWDDMQFSFAYFYYVIHKKRDFDLDKFYFETLDNDGDGRLSRDEVKYMGMFIAGKRVIPEDVS